MHFKKLLQVARYPLGVRIEPSKNLMVIYSAVENKNSSENSQKEDHGSVTEPDIIKDHKDEYHRIMIERED